jgi:DNA-binding transcriptional MocR family regulator
MWKPRIGDRDGPIYRAIVDALQEDVSQGHLKPGTQLPTQRALADVLKITVSTVTRAYGEAKRLGLVDGEVGRGTYVRQLEREDGRGLRGDRDGEFVDLVLNRPALNALDVHLRDALTRILNHGALTAYLDYPVVMGGERQREAGASWVGRAGVKADADRIIVCNGAQQALFAAIAGHASPGDAIATEHLNYLGIRRIADFLRLPLVGLPIDAEGIEPDGFAEACARAPIALLVCTPGNHNPTTATMSLKRRRRILDIARRNGVTVIENDVHGPLLGGRIPSLFSLSEGATVYISSISKAIAPGLRLGYLVCGTPAAMNRCAEVVHTNTWGTAPLIGDIMSVWIETGVADRFIEHHLRCAHERVKLAHRILGGTRARLQSSPESYHLWLNLPPEIQMDDFVMNLRMRNVAVTPGTWFSIDGGPVNAVRLSLGSAASIDQLETGLRRIAEVLQGGIVAPLL